MTDLPIIRQAQRDLELGRLALAVFDLLRDRLDLVEFRPVKLQELEDALARTRPRVIGALRELAERGYIERGALAWQRGPRTYRLCYSRGRPAPAAAAAMTSGARASGTPQGPEKPEKPEKSEKPKRFGMVSRGLEW